MLQYTNTEHTRAEFNGVSLSLAAPEDWDSVGDGPTRRAVQAWLAAGNTPAAYVKPLGERKAEIERGRDATIAAGAVYGGNTYQCDQLMVAAVIGRLVRWQLGRIPPAQLLPVRTKDNKIVLLGQAQHAELGDAIDAVIGGAYAASWTAKDAIT